jgi:hypothetical protein
MIKGFKSREVREFVEEKRIVIIYFDPKKTGRVKNLLVRKIRG